VFGPKVLKDAKRQV
jgi:hypothetical protein